MFSASVMGLLVVQVQSGQDSKFDNQATVPPGSGPKAVKVVYERNTKTHSRTYHVRECTFAEKLCVWRQQHIIYHGIKKYTREKGE